jgi:uncharacterized protein (DUF2147 family)
MRRSLLLLSVLSLLLVLVGCASEPAKTETAPEAAAPEAAAPDASADPLTGTWTGDWGPSANDRNKATLDLKLDGTNVTGSIKPEGAAEAVAITKGTFAKDTGTLNLEADAKDRAGKTVHYVVDGKLEGTTLSGTWTHDDKKGDFKVTKG